MSTAATRLELYEAILSLIERKREECGDERLGANIERVVLSTQFQELESEFLENPGPLAPWLVQGRRGVA
jgi:hypothetical protein